MMKVKDVRKALKNFRPDEEVLVIDVRLPNRVCSLENIMKRSVNSVGQAMIIIDSKKKKTL